jgi:hypothetical protein
MEQRPKSMGCWIISSGDTLTKLLSLWYHGLTSMGEATRAIYKEASRRYDCGARGR